MASELTIIRHSPTEYNEQNFFMGTLDIPITSFDEKKIEELKKVLSIDKYTSIYSSPLQRSLQTAKQIFGDKYPILIDNRLIERNLGVWQGVRKDVIRKKYVEAFKGNQMDVYYTPENGEPFKLMIHRVASFISDICKDNTHNLIFTHNAVFRVFKSFLTDIPLSSAFSKNEPFLTPQKFIIEDSLYNRIQSNPFFTVDKNIII